MVFLRTKKINNHSYCYLVENQYSKKGSQQKVKKYLGRVFQLVPSREIDSFDLPKKITKEEMLNKLIQSELLRHNFKEKNQLLINKEIAFDPRNLNLFKKKKEVVAALNQGFLCQFTTKRILDFKKTKDFQKDAYTLARYFVEAGLNVSQELFVQFYEKCSNK